jgi:predicted nucleotidyltransferase component of viral defense system
MLYNPLELREVFHLEFLRRFGRKIKTEVYALKGGSNLRFFFNSIRYSQDMYIDVNGVEVNVLAGTVLNILKSPSFLDILIPFGIKSIRPPDMNKAKQTQTTQLFKIHIMSKTGEDLFTKVEFSRRGFAGKAVVQPVSSSIVRYYQFAPLLAPHYDMESAAIQKIRALAQRSVIQARDIFDLYVLSLQSAPKDPGGGRPSLSDIRSAYENIFVVSYEQFRDTVASYLSSEDRALYESAEMWDEIKIEAAEYIKSFENE